MEQVGYRVRGLKDVILLEPFSDNTGERPCEAGDRMCASKRKTGTQYTLCTGPLQLLLCVYVRVSPGLIFELDLVIFRAYFCLCIQGLLLVYRE